MKSILEYLERSAARFPDKTAFADETEQCTFAELRAGAKRAGSAFARLGCIRKPVPVLMEKGVRTIEILMGIVYAGGFYVMLDTAQPAGRLEQILSALEAEFLVTDENGESAAAKAPFAGKKILDCRRLLQAEIDDALLKEVRAQRQDIWPLYVMFTSGSSGIPKGVVVSHRSVMDFMEEFTKTFGITDQDVLGNQAPWDFDVSVKDIYAGLKTGATVQIIPRQYFSFPMLLLDFLEERGVTSLTWAVSALCIVSALNGFSYKVPDRIRRILFSGETMPVRHLNYWRRFLPDAMFVNLYGPTEITCNCTYYVLDRAFAAGDVIPIGRAFANEHVFLLDDKDQEVRTPGVEGEICVSGTALALGYYNDREQTERVFVQNPLNHCYQELIYRTGDMGIYDENGDLCFVSRRDFQIKHMGHRIELGEIEAALEKVDEVVRSCCVFDTAGNKIVCFYQGDIERRALGRALGDFLPDYMIPNVFCRVEEMPLTKNGKTDRKRLLESCTEGKSRKRKKEDAKNG